MTVYTAEELGDKLLKIKQYIEMLLLIKQTATLVFRQGCRASSWLFHFAHYHWD